MDIKDEFTCRCCNEIYQSPISLICCGENICKQHIEELISKSSSIVFTCPLCMQENSNQNFHINSLLVKLIKKELHKFELGAKYETTLNNLRNQVFNLETILKDPENLIYEEICELKRQVDLDKERLKSQIDKLADELIRELESFEKKFKIDYKANVDLHSYEALAKSARKQLIDYEKCLYLFSAKYKERVEKRNESEKVINKLKTNIKKLKDAVLLNLEIRYKPVRHKEEDLFGKLVIKVK